MERVKCTFKAFFNIVARKQMPPTCQQYLNTFVNFKICMHAFSRFATDPVVVVSCFQATMTEAQNSRPIPWCHVCIWSGGDSVAPPPGKECKLGGGLFTALVEGLSCLHKAVGFISHHSLSFQFTHSWHINDHSSSQHHDLESKMHIADKAPCCYKNDIFELT